jgi:hypothetical protein
MGCLSSKPQCAACGSVTHETLETKGLCKMVSLQSDIHIGSSIPVKKFCQTKDTVFLMFKWLTGQELLNFGITCKSNRRYLWKNKLTPIGRLKTELLRRGFRRLPEILLQNKAIIYGEMVLGALIGSTEVPQDWNCALDINVHHEYFSSLYYALTSCEQKIPKLSSGQNYTFEFINLETDQKDTKETDKIITKVNIHVAKYYHSDEAINFDCLRNFYNGRKLKLCRPYEAFGKICYWLPCSHNAQIEWNHILKYMSRGFTIYFYHDRTKQITEFAQIEKWFKDLEDRLAAALTHGGGDYDDEGNG